jgi:hypothetical protein
VSAGRGEDKEAHLSMARLYFSDISEVREKTFGKLNVSESPTTSTYIGFLLQTVSESRSEKVQTVPLAGDSSHSTFFGESPRQYVFNGILFNSPNARWREIFSKLYQHYLRGYMAAGNGRPVQVVYDNKIVSGWVTAISQNLSSTNEMVSPFNMTIQVIKETILTEDQDLLDNFNKYVKNQSIEGGIDSVDNTLPVDDYVRKATMKLPPRAQGGGISGRCRVKDPTKVLHNKTLNANTKSPVKSSSPTTTTCDMGEALIIHYKNLHKGIELQKKAGNNTKKSARAQAIIITAQKNLKRLQKWNKVVGVSGAVSYRAVLSSGGYTQITTGEGMLGEKNLYSGKVKPKTLREAYKAAKKKK